MSASDVELVREAWAAFGRSDFETIASALSAEVRWHGVDDPDSGCRGREEAVEFVKRTLADGTTAEATDVRGVGDRVLVVVQLHHPPEWGDEPQPHGEIVTVRDGQIAEILVYPDVPEALRALGRHGGEDRLSADAE